MRNKKPPFEITNQMIDQVVEIAELVGKDVYKRQAVVFQRCDDSIDPCHTHAVQCVPVCSRRHASL